MDLVSCGLMQLDLANVKFKVDWLTVLNCYSQALKTALHATIEARILNIERVSRNIKKMRLIMAHTGIELQDKLWVLSAPNIHSTHCIANSADHAVSFFYMQ